MLRGREGSHGSVSEVTVHPPVQMRAIRYGQSTVIELNLRVVGEDVALNDPEGVPEPGNNLPRDQLGGLLAARCRDHIDADRTSDSPW